jgi:hypothetical protein
MGSEFPETFEILDLEGCLQKTRGDWTEREGIVFMEKFFSWLRRQGVTFGGLYAGIEKGGSTHSHLLFEELHRLKVENETLRGK